jgi:hypothetical protein
MSMNGQQGRSVDPEELLAQADDAARKWQKCGTVSSGLIYSPWGRSFG